MKILLISVMILTYVSTAAGQHVDVDVSDVPSIKQPSTMSCWAAAFTMLYSWKNKMSSSINDALKTVPDHQKYINIFTSNTGISSTDEKDFYNNAGMTLVQQFNPSIQGWASLLRERGPISITVDANPPQGTIHALVVTGIKGDGTSQGTKIKYIDPGDGLLYNVRFSDFIQLYEGSANWPNQILYY